MIVANHTQLINFYYNKILSGWKNDTAKGKTERLEEMT